MKRIFVCMLLLAGVLPFSFARGIGEAVPESSEQADVSYAFGMLIAGDLLTSEMEFDAASFIRGFRAAMDGGDLRFSDQEAMALVQDAFMNAQDAKAAAEAAAGVAFLAENALKEGVTVTESGLQYEVLVAGTGATPDISDTVRVHYQGTTLDGNVFDSSYDDEPMEIPLDWAIPGWSEGLRMMKVGETARFVIPPELAYDNAVLIFEVQLLAIVGSDDGEGESENE